MPAVLPTASYETLDGIPDRQKVLIVNLIFTVLIQPNLFCIDTQSGCGFQVMEKDWYWSSNCISKAFLTI